MMSFSFPSRFSSLSTLSARAHSPSHRGALTPYLAPSPSPRVIRTLLPLFRHPLLSFAFHSKSFHSSCTATCKLGFRVLFECKADFFYPPPPPRSPPGSCSWDEFCACDKAETFAGCIFVRERTRSQELRETLVDGNTSAFSASVRYMEGK